MGAIGRAFRSVGSAIRAAQQPAPTATPGSVTEVEGLPGGPIVVPPALPPKEPRGTALVRFLQPILEGAAAGAQVPQQPGQSDIAQGFAGFGAAAQARRERGLLATALARQQRQDALAESAEARAQQRFETEQADAPIKRAGLLQGLQLGQANVERLGLANQIAARQLQLTGDASAFDTVEREVVSSLGQLSGPEQSLLTAARAKARQEGKLDPFFDFASRVVSQRGIEGRSEASRSAAMDRLAITQANAINKLLLSQGVVAPGFLSAEQEGAIAQAAQRAAQRITTGEAKLTNFGRALHAQIFDSLGTSLIATGKQREGFAGLGQAERLLDLVEREVERVIALPTGVDKAAASVVLNDLSNSLGAIFSRQVFQEKGTLTDQDVKRATALLPKWKSANFAPGIARTEIAILREILDGAKQKTLDEFRTFQRPAEGQQKRRFRIDASGNVVEVRE